MYYKISNNKILKIENGIKTKIILTLEPFCIEEIDVNEHEKSDFSYMRFNQKYDYDENKLEKIEVDDIISLFKKHIISSYNEFIRRKNESIDEKIDEKNKISMLSVDYSNYAVGSLYYGKNIYAVKINDKWYEYNHKYNEEKLSMFKKNFVEDNFTICDKDTFLEIYKNDNMLILDNFINNLNNTIVKLKKNQLELLNCNMSFIIR